MPVEFENGEGPLVPEIPEYVLGFVFSDQFAGDKSEVVLILKQKPANQAGKLNGVGGRIEPGEEPNAAMCREYLEEAGVATEPPFWHKVGKIIFPGAIVYVFAAHGPEVVRCSRTETHEIIWKIKINNLNMYARMQNLDWIIPLCITALRFPYSSGSPWTPLEIRENWN